MVFLNFGRQLCRKPTLKVLGGDVAVKFSHTPPLLCGNYKIPFPSLLISHRQNPSDVRPSKILHTRVQNLQITEHQIELPIIRKVTPTVSIAIFLRQLFGQHRNQSTSIFGPRVALLFFLHDTPSHIPISCNGGLPNRWVCLLPSLLNDRTNIIDEIVWQCNVLIPNIYLFCHIQIFLQK